MVGNSFGGKLFVDGSLMCKHGSQGGQAGWAVAQIHETSHESVCAAHGAMPISLLEAAAYLAGRVVGTVAGHHPVGAVLRGSERGPKWCTAARRPHANVWRRIWDCFRDIGDEAHIDSMTKCKAHLSKAERAKLKTGSFMAAGNELADEVAKEGARDDSFQSIVCDTYKGAVETCKAIISYIGSFILRAKGGERWPAVVAPPQGWDEKDGRWKRAIPILAQPHILRRSGRHWQCEVCDKRASGGAAKAKLVRTECVGASRDDTGRAREAAVSLSGLRLAALCGAAEKLGEPCVGHPRSQEYARSIHLLSSGWHPQGESLSWTTQAVHNANMGHVAAKLPRGQLR